MIVIRGFPNRAARYIVSSRTKRYIEAHVNDSSYSLPKFCVFRNHHPPPPPPTRARARGQARGASCGWRWGDAAIVPSRAWFAGGCIYLVQSDIHPIVRPAQ
jgi:hypothetical protein